jgi:hypothetical protein
MSIAILDISKDPIASPKAPTAPACDAPRHEAIAARPMLGHHLDRRRGAPRLIS